MWIKLRKSRKHLGISRLGFRRKLFFQDEYEELKAYAE
jgi:hypothetical protein